MERVYRNYKLYCMDKVRGGEKPLDYHSWLEMEVQAYMKYYGDAG